MEKLAPTFRLISAKLSHLSVIVLLVSNIFPLYGVLFLGWRTFPLLYLYWLENVFIGIFNVLKMLCCQSPSAKPGITKLAIIPFFCVHYGIFTLVHGIFVFTLFGDFFTDDLFEPFSLGGFQSIWNYGMFLAGLELFLSHGISFGLNYIKGGEYKRVNLMELMQAPYGRVIVMHLTILGGAFLMVVLGSPVAGLIVLIVLKIALDLRAHIKEHFKIDLDKVLPG